jgi:hypothetical protein
MFAAKFTGFMYLSAGAEGYEYGSTGPSEAGQHAYCWSSHTRGNEMTARQLHVDFSQRRTYQRGIWTAIMVYAPINLSIIDNCRFPSYALTCSRLRAERTGASSWEKQSRLSYIPANITNLNQEMNPRNYILNTTGSRSSHIVSSV